MRTFAKEIQKARQMAKRNRSAVACARCKATKSKCSDYRPCKTCASVKMSCEELPQKKNQANNNALYPHYMDTTLHSRESCSKNPLQSRKPEPFTVEKAVLNQHPMTSLEFLPGLDSLLNPAPISFPTNVSGTDLLHLSLAMQLAAFGQETVTLSETFGQLYSAPTSNTALLMLPNSRDPAGFPPAIVPLFGSPSAVLPLGPSFSSPRMPVLPAAAAMGLLLALAARPEAAATAARAQL